MGAGQSRSGAESPAVFHNDTPIKFSQDVVNHLSDQLTSPSPSSSRQAGLDEHIKSKIQSELAHLRAQEEEVRREIEATLEKENLERERELAGKDSQNEDGSTESGGVLSGDVLLGDLDEIRRKVDKYHSRKAFESLATVRAKAADIVDCYSAHPKSELDCWREVQNFRLAVGQAEHDYFNSLT